jgi:uncharacterized membrane protein
MVKNVEQFHEGEVKETSRLEAFSDGVFAISITLLILELIQVLKVESHSGIMAHLFQHLDAFFAFAIGFLTILICWINHHLVFTYIRKVDSHLMWVNGFVLLVVTFTPFATALLSDYFDTEKNTALAFFGFNFFMMAIAAYCLTAYVYNRNLVGQVHRGQVQRFKTMYAWSILYNLVVFFVCFFSVVVAVALYMLLFIVFAYPREFSSRFFSPGKIKNSSGVQPE